MKVTTRPPTAMVPLKSVVPVLGAAVHANDPDPVPLPPGAIVSQVELDTADHGQSTELVVTCTVPRAPMTQGAAPTIRWRPKSLVVRSRGRHRADSPVTARHLRASHVMLIEIEED
jgi:hypothetical protein